MSDIIFKVILAYLTGSIVGSLLLGKLKHVDIRALGSGNAGGTNALRTQGKLFALGVIVIDIGKGAVAAGVVPALTLLSNVPTPLWLPYACGAAAFFGHVFPVFHGFRGGKGAATLVGTVLVLQPALVAPILVVWISTLALSGYVGMATMVATNTAAPLAAVLYWPNEKTLLIYLLAMGLASIFTHRSNIARMLAGTESRNPKLMLFKPK